MDSQKKTKQRTRNRPRNKANRSVVPITNEAASEASINASNLEASSSLGNSNVVNTTTNSIKNPTKSLTITENSLNLKVNESIQAIQANSESNNGATIQLIQQLIRNKFLNRNLQKQNVHASAGAIKIESANDNSGSASASSSSNVKTELSVIEAVPTKTTTKLPLLPTAATTTALLNKIKEAKSNKDCSTDSTVESFNKNVFINNLQKKVGENVKTNELPAALLSNLQKLLEQEPISDVESTDDEDEYIEYIYKPRPYFIATLCNFCKCNLLEQEQLMPCKSCQMTYYCSKEHMKNDAQHRQLCYAIRQVSDSSNGHIFYNCGDFTSEQFRSYRIVNIRKIEAVANRTLNATEQEVILFPRICHNNKCREYRFERLEDCRACGQVAFCKKHPDHLSATHQNWCKAFKLFKELIMFQEKFGRLEPSLPSKILKDLPGACSNTKQILKRLGFEMQDACEYAALSQLSTGPLTAWYALKLCEQLKTNNTTTIHLIGAEIEFEVHALHKWELFFMHITPTLKDLNIVFVGPELNPNNISFEQLKKTKCCRSCRKSGRNINYYFENQIYHEYCNSKDFLKPTLVCFFNAGLYRASGYQWEDTWPETIYAAANFKCPVVVTSYTQYEAPLDLTRFIQESNRRLNIILPPIVNPFASEKPERNFISDEEAPLMFKNYYCFVIE